MPYTKLTHEECRKNVCFFCLRKADRKLNSGIIELIKTRIPDYDRLEPYLPAGFCGACRVKRSKSEQLPHQNYNEIYSVLSKVKDLRSANCNCFVCKTARAKNTARSQNEPQPAPEPEPEPVPVPEPIPPSPSTSSPPPLSFDQMMQQPLEVRQRVVSQTLKDMAGGSSGTVSVKTGGRPLPVHLGAIPKQPNQISHEDMHDMQKEFCD